MAEVEDPEEINEVDREAAPVEAWVPVSPVEVDPLPVLAVVVEVPPWVETAARDRDGTWAEVAQGRPRNSTRRRAASPSA